MVAFSKTIRIYTPIVFALILGLRTGILPVSNYITPLLIRSLGEFGDVIVSFSVFITVIINFIAAVAINYFLNIFFLKRADQEIHNTP